MSDFPVSPLDAGAVTILIVIVQYLKKYITKRWVPVLPFIAGWLLAVPVVLVVKGTELSIWVFVSNVFLDGLKMAVLSMAAYPVGKMVSGKGKAKTDV